MRNAGTIAGLILILDRATKAFAHGLTRPVTLIPGVLGLRYVENTGMAFSLFSGNAWALGLVSAGVIVGLTLFLRRYRPALFRDAAADLIIGGALGNLIDRLLMGYVVDMIEILLFPFAVFNVADMALTVGCALMAWSLLFRPGDWVKRDER